MSREQWPVVRAVVRQQWTLLRRDRRLIILSAVLVLASVAAVVSGLARQQQWMLERTAAVAADTDNWERQGEVDPHHAAHFGHYAFKPISLLAAVDPGLLDHLGLMVRLEAHQQNVAVGRPADYGTPLSRFASFSAAQVLQLLGPLLVILVGFTAFAGTRARTLLDQEMSAGADGRVLLLGRLLTTGLTMAAVLALIAVAGTVVLIMEGADASALRRLALMTAGYGFYLFTFLALSIGVSALASQSRAALTVLLALWVTTVVMVPRVVPAVAARAHPAPTATQLLAQVQAAVDAALDREGPKEERVERARASVMREYGVAQSVDLPLHERGLLLEQSERLTTTLYREQFTHLEEIYDRQETLQRRFAVFSPLIALKSWSAALAGSDLVAHNQFLAEAETYRYRFVQALNRDLALNHSRTADSYSADAAEVTAALGVFRPSQESVRATLERQWPDLAILFLWASASLGFAIWCGGRLEGER